MKKTKKKIATKKKVVAKKKKVVVRKKIASKKPKSIMKLSQEKFDYFMAKIAAI